jgi:hypothetical protein
LSRQYGILNISQPYRPPEPVIGIALLYFYCVSLIPSYQKGTARRREIRSKIILCKNSGDETTTQKFMYEYII